MKNVVRPECIIINFCRSLLLFHLRKRKIHQPEAKSWACVGLFGEVCVLVKHMEFLFISSVPSSQNELAS